MYVEDAMQQFVLSVCCQYAVFRYAHHILIEYNIPRGVNQLYIVVTGTIKSQ
jgi:hypothetical protein